MLEQTKRVGWLVVLLVSPALGGLPGELAVQGLLRDGGGSVVNGQRDLDIAFYDAAVAGNLKDINGDGFADVGDIFNLLAVDVTDGLFSVQIGSLHPSACDGTATWMEISVDGSPLSRTLFVGCPNVSEQVNQPGTGIAAISVDEATGNVAVGGPVDPAGETFQVAGNAKIDSTLFVSVVAGASPLEFKTGVTPTTRMTIADDGRVAIGAAAPVAGGEALQVDGVAKSTEVKTNAVVTSLSELPVRVGELRALSTTFRANGLATNSIETNAIDTTSSIEFKTSGVTRATLAPTGEWAIGAAPVPGAEALQVAGVVKSTEVKTNAVVTSASELPIRVGELRAIVATFNTTGLETTNLKTTTVSSDTDIVFQTSGATRFRVSDSLSEFTAADGSKIMMDPINKTIELVNGPGRALEPLAIIVNGSQVMSLSPPLTGANGESPNVIFGYSGNSVGAGVYGGTISGGGSEGEPNTVMSEFGTCGGGKSNNASGFLSTVGGGKGNTASDWATTVAGGGQNAASSGKATISGGWGNTASGESSTVAGGEVNMASGNNSNVAGGGWNAASGDNSTVGGGVTNSASGPSATVAGGNNNTASAFAAVVGGGNWNLANADYSAIAGGISNTASGTSATVGGGNSNTASGASATVAGGSSNAASAYAAVVGGGSGNVANGQSSVIAGGQSNTASGDESFIGGGSGNTASGGTSFIGGGSGNTASDWSATVPGGSGNQAGGQNSFAAGYQATVRDAAASGGPGGDSGTFVWCDSGGNTSNRCTSSGYNQFIIQASGGVGIGRAPTANDLEVEGTASKTAAGSWLANSDRRIKQDIRSIDGPLETLEKVRLVSFRYTDEYRADHPSIEDHRYINVIAQEFAEVFPDYVKNSGEKLPGGGEILQVDTYPLTIYSAAAIQEIYGIIKEKDARNAALQARVTALEKRLDRLSPSARISTLGLTVPVMAIAGLIGLAAFGRGRKGGA